MASTALLSRSKAAACTCGAAARASSSRLTESRRGLKSTAGFKEENRSSTREFILSVLSAQPSKRDSRFYLSNFAAPSASSVTDPLDSIPAFPVSNGSTPTTAFPRLSPSSSSSGAAPTGKEEDELAPLKKGKTKLARELMMLSNRHTALVKVQGPFTQRQLESVAEGMVYLKKLGLVSIIVVDSEEWWPSLTEAKDAAMEADVEVLKEKTRRKRERMKLATLQFVELLEAKGGSARPLLEGVLKTCPESDDGTSRAKSDPEEVKVVVDSLSGIRDAIRLGEIPVIPPIALGTNCFSHIVSANSALAALAEGLAAASHKGVATAAEGDWESDKKWKSDVDLLPVRMMIINREGGIPSHARGGNPHLSINLASELPYIQQTFVWSSTHPTSLANLEVIGKCLVHLPRTASAVVVSHRSPRALIANLITNKPAHSPSLHQSLLPSSGALLHTPTIVRRGLPIRVFRSMKDVDMGKMTTLLEASFGRKLNCDPFYERMERDLDFCIVAGDYQGCAIVTNEMLRSPDGEVLSDQEPIAYLDKFAVLPSLQGDGTVDFLWGALRDESFGLGLLDALNPNVGGLQGQGVPRDLVWRSRTNNPVNKWYFERSNGFFRIPPPPGTDGGFSLFWCEKETAPGKMGSGSVIEQDTESGQKGRLKYWEQVISQIPACWLPRE